MATQSINNYYFNKYDIRLDSSSYYDLTLAADERGYDEEVVFSNDIIAANDGNRMPINIDLNSIISNQKQTLLWNQYYSGNTLVSKNYYNPNNEDLSCYTGFSGLCDVGLVGTDNGLYTKMSGETLYFTKGLIDGVTSPYYYHPHYYDRRMKFHPVTGYTSSPNTRFSGITADTVYSIVSRVDDNVGYYNELYGGFFQGFYKLNGWDYEVFPERVNKGWTAEFMLKPRQRDDYTLGTGQTYLNTVYPNNAGTFFYFGTRAENKYYHPASGDPQDNITFSCDFSFDISGATTEYYQRVTSGLTNCLFTCACADTGVTTSDCMLVYPLSSSTVQHYIGPNCSYNTLVPDPPINPALDVVSNALSLRFSGDPKNPRLCVKYIKLTGDCVTTGSCETTGLTYNSGYTINEICSTRGIYFDCNYDSVTCFTANTFDRWVMISAVFERYETLEDCDLLNVGGLGDIRRATYSSITNNTAYNLIMPPQTHPGSPKEKQQIIIDMNRKWLDDVRNRRGLLKLYVNGYLFLIIEDFEEIIPRELNTAKEKQIGVPFNISIGGGTQGLRENLIFESCSGATGPYMQDPELFPDNVLSGTSLSGLSTNILLEQNFGGTFMGGLSKFRMYVEPLNSAQIQHNYRIYKEMFDLYDFWCSDCYECLLECYFDFHLAVVPCPVNEISQELLFDYNFDIITEYCEGES